MALRCQHLERDMQNIYIGKNNRNLIFSLNKGANEEEVKNRFVKKSDIIKADNVWVINSKHRNKSVVKTSFSNKMLMNADFSLSKDYPKDVRAQRSYLLRRVG